jgi:glycosyltransferase involved in cell wall biosynthesis
MRVHFDNVNLSSRSGPNTFAGRLARELVNAGVEITDGDSDVDLVFIEPSGQRRGRYRRLVQRLDGIWFKPEEFHIKNRNIRALYDNADAVVFQSNFDKNMATKWFGAPRRGEVIHNGISLARVAEVTIPELAKIRATYNQVFVCSSNWHPQKRLRANIQLFDRLRKTQFPNSCLFIMGANPDVMTTDPHVLYTGSQPPEVYLQVFAVANWMLHLAWADHCPNVVIESLCQGTPVVCSDVGGTRELVGNFGIVVEDVPYDYDLADYDNPPPIDTSHVVLPDKAALGSHADIDIRNVARRYLNLFREVVTC